MNKTKKLLFTLLSLVFVICMFSVSASAATYKYNNQNLEVQTEGDWQYVILTEAALTDAEREMGVKAGDAYTTKYTGTAASVNVPNKLGGANVSFVGYQTFKGNTAVQTVTVGTSVKYISSEAFMDCSGLQQVLISQNVTGINNNAFRNCTALKTVTFHKDIKLTNINEGAFYNCKSLNKFNIPATVTTIGNYAFRKCDSLLEITIPDSVTDLGAAAFIECASLATVTIGKGVKEIKTIRDAWNDHGVENAGVSKSEHGTFERCISLTTVNFGESIEKISMDSFAGCSLLSVELPESAKVVEQGAFMNCESLKNVDFGLGLREIGGQAFAYNYALEEVEMHNNLLSIGDLAFFRCNSLKKIVIPKSVISLGEGAFALCTSMTSANIGNGVTELKTKRDAWNDLGVTNQGTSKTEHGTFEGCSSLKEITFGNAITEIGQDCFAGTMLETISIPENIKIISTGAFCNCYSLKSVDFGNGVTTIGDLVFENDYSLSNVNIGKSVVSIGERTFANCDSLTKLDIPSNVTSLGAAMFLNCDNLENVVIGNGVTALNTKRDAWNDLRITNRGVSDSEHGTFEGCTKLSSITLGSGLIYIGMDTFAGTQITSLTVPSKVSELAEGAFAGATKLKDIYFTGNWAAKAGGRLFENVAPEYTVYYIKNKIGYGDLEYKKAEFAPITVSFDNNNDDVFAVTTDDQIMAPVGGYVIEPIIPAASGYRFVGWYKDSKCTNAWNFETDKVTKNTTLYAKWDDVNKVKPIRPEELTSDAVTGKTISLTWQAVDGATSYNVYVDGKKVNAKAVTTSSYTVENLKADTTYEIEVTAVNSKGESPKSLILAKRTGELSAADMIPVAPTEVKSGKITETDIEITWKAVDGATSYNVYVDGKKVTKTAVAETKYTIASLKAGTTYVIEVTAVNTVGESPKSKSISATTVAPKYNLGDVNNDGKITAADARFALRMSVKLEKPTEIQKLAADIDGNKNVTAADARIILRISVNLEKIDSYKK